MLWLLSFPYPQWQTTSHHNKHPATTGKCPSINQQPSISSRRNCASDKSEQYPPTHLQGLYRWLPWKIPAPYFHKNRREINLCGIIPTLWRKHAKFISKQIYFDRGQHRHWHNIVTEAVYLRAVGQTLTIPSSTVVYFKRPACSIKTDKKCTRSKFNEKKIKASKVMKWLLGQQLRDAIDEEYYIEL